MLQDPFCLEDTSAYFKYFDERVAEIFGEIVFYRID